MDINKFDNLTVNGHCLLGFYISGRYLRGMAVNLLDPTRPLTAEIFVNGHLMASICSIGILYGHLLSDHLEGDAALNISQHREIPGGFEFFLSDYLPLSSPMSISIRAKLGQSECGHLERIVDIASYTFQRLKPLIDARPLIRFNALSQNENVIIISAICNGSELDQIGIHGENCEVTELTCSPTLPHYVFPEKIRGVHLTAKLCIINPKLEARVNLTKNGIPFGRFSDSFFIPAHLSANFKNAIVPMAEQIDRVMASKSKLDYLFSGYASFKTIENLLAKHTQLTITPELSILDWGVGCGRVARHFIDANCQVKGVDIDPQNVAWCRQNLAGLYEQISPQPPTNLSDNSIDFAFGISIFTHLTEDDQFRWLDELQRLIRPKGYALMTIQSEYALLRGQEPARRILSLNERGIDDAVIGTRLDDVVGKKSDYYRETFHQHQYIIQNWSRWFDVIAIESGEHFSHQDYVILRAR
jgi:SAM-dependent methyltransferase